MNINWEKLNKRMGQALRGFCTLSFIALTVIMSGVVLIRFWPIAKLSWSDEIIELLVAWIVFAGAAELWRTNSHFRIDAVYQFMSSLRFGWLYSFIIESAAMGFILLFTIYSFDLTISAIDVSPILSWPRPIWYAVMPISGVIMTGCSIANIIAMFKRTAHQDQAEPNA